ncbi:Uncharacterized protein conserved in bacteria [Streptobacillus moniliformis]|nr:Uncharacterized protein conserved in bacteria [Streptobacillus moniliformis]
MLRNLYSLNKYTHSFESDTLDIDNKAFILKEFEINKDNLKMTAYNVNTGLEITSETKVEKNKSGEFKTIKDELLKKELDKKENLIEISDYFKDKVLFDLKIVDFEEIDTVEPEIISILYKMITALKEEVYSKNRENHLHHSLDAFLLTIMNRSMQMKLIKYNQLISVLKNKEIEIFNEEKGEYIDSKNLLKSYKNKK